MTCYVHPKAFSSRVAMLSQIQPGGAVAEIGVFDGGFSEELLRLTSPRLLLLIDLWADEMIFSGDADGNNVRQFHGRVLESQVRKRFDSNGIVDVRRGTSAILRDFPDSYFDAIYVDAAHEYEPVRRDLIAAYRALRPGGWLMGHDYGVNPERTDSRWEFGVRPAVDDFCRDFREEISCFGMDGCTSFGIKVRKDGAELDHYAGRLRSARSGLVNALTNAPLSLRKHLASAAARLSNQRH